MSFAGSIDASIEIIGGLVCDMAPSELPLGVSPDCQDCQYTKSAAETRPGLTSQFAALVGNPTVNFLKTYIKQDGTLRLLAYDSQGNLFKENPQGTLASVQAGVGPQSPYANSDTYFGREYIAFGDGKIGQDIPRQFDDTFLDRVTQSGPGAPPSVADENVSVNISQITQPATVAITAASAVGFLATITAAGHGLNAGDSTTIAGMTPAGYNGTFPVASVIDANHFTYVAGTAGLGPGTVFGTSGSTTSTVQTASAHGLVVGQLATIANGGVAGYNGTFAVVTVPDATHFTYRAGTGGLGANGAAGTVSPGGSISAGVHGLAVAFQTRQGGIFICPVTANWTAAGGRRAVVSGIPVGPSNVTARILLFTSSGGATYLWIPQGSSTLFSGVTVIADNVTTTVTVDFTDAILLAATNGQFLFSQIVLPEVAGAIDYGDRVIWWGERNTIKNWLNLDFCGGFGANGTPLGWTRDATFGPGSAQASVQGDPIVWGDAYSIVGNGVTFNRGLITQSAVTDVNGVPLIKAGIGYSVRARVARNNLLAQGTLHINLFSASGGINTPGLQVTANQAGTSYLEFTGVLTAALAAIPSDLLLRIYADGAPTNNGDFVVGTIEIFPTSTPTNPSVVRGSEPFTPERIDGVNGFLQVAQNNGQAIRAGFKMRDRLYFVKEHSLWATQDNGQSFSTWTITRISPTVGTLSVRGVGRATNDAGGEDWVVIADRAGLYIFWGSEPMKISQEIGNSASKLTLAWNQINWLYGHTLWVAVDTQERRIYVGAPFGAATSPNKILMLDYRDIDGGADVIANSPPVRIRYTGVKAVMDKSRKWSPWTISANHAAIVERFDGTQQLFLGAGSFGNQAPNGVPTGKIYKLDPANLTDDGLAIPSYYLTAFTPQRETEQILQLHAHRKLYTYLTMYAEGTGYLNMTAFPVNENFPQPLPSLRLTNPASKDLETPINVFGERVAFKVASDTSVPGNWFRLQKLTPSMVGDPWAPVRGQN
jgi:hypothetical protein